MVIFEHDSFLPFGGLMNKYSGSVVEYKGGRLLIFIKLITIGRYKLEGGLSTTIVGVI